MRLFPPPPEFADPAQARTARLVYSVVGIVLVLALGFLLVAVSFLHEDTSHWVYSVGLGSAACLPILELNRRGRVRAAGILLVAMLWALFTDFAALGGGILAPVTSGYLVLIFLAGFLLDARAVWWTAALCGSTCLAFFAANFGGWLPPSAEHTTPQSHGAILVLMMLIVLGLQHLAARNVAARAASEASVRASENKFRALFAAMSNVVLVLDRDGRVLEIAPTNPDPLYRPAPDWLGHTLAEVFSPELAALFVGQIRLALAADRPHFFDYRLLLGDRVVWFTATLSPLPPGRLLLVARDITDRKQAEEALQRAQADLELRVQARTLELNRANSALLDEVTERTAAESRLRAFAAALPDTAFIVNAGEHFEEILTATSPLPGTAPADLQGHPLAEFFAPGLAEAFHHVILRVLETGEIQSIEYALPAAHQVGGDRLPGDLGGTPMPRLPAEVGGTGVPPVGSSVPAETDRHPAPPAANITRWFEGRAAPLLLGGGDRKLVVFVVRDITRRKQIEDRLFESRQMLQLILDHIPQRIFWKDRAGHYLGCNRVFAHDVGLDEPAAIVGLTDRDLLWRDQADAFRTGDRTVLETGAPLLAQEEEIPGPDGQRRWVLTNRIALRDSEGLVIGVLGSHDDITTQKRSEETLRKLSRAVEQSPTSIVITDREARIEYVNAKFTELTGYTLEEALGRNPSILNSGQTPRETFQQMWTTILAGSEWRGEFHNRKKNGELYWEAVIISPLKNPAGAITHFVAVKEDITSSKQAGRILNAALAELERSNRDLEQFAYIASHDLQEPLRLVSSFVQLLGQRYRGRLDADADQFIGFAVDGAQRMQTLIQDLLAYSRMGREMRPFVPVDCGAIMAQVVQTLSLAIRDQQATVACDPLPTVPGDPIQLGQLFQNLVANALKFHRDEPPQVHVSAVLTKDRNFWQFAVRDNGIGIDAEFYDRIFVIFQRLHGRRKYPGSGIGLSICKKIVELHGGRIWVDSVKDRGTIFFFTLPRTPIA
jgi:PAS domain S-box-containing protein